MSSKNHIEVVDALFRVPMTDPNIDDRSGLIVRRPYVSKSRRATVKLPDLKTIIVTQDMTDIDEVRPYVLRSTREAFVEQVVTISLGWRRRRTERVGIQIAHFGFGIDVDDFGQDAEVIEEVREELEIPPYMNLISAYEVDDIPLIRADNFYFRKNGGLVDESREQDLNTTFSLLSEIISLSAIEPAISASTIR